MPRLATARVGATAAIAPPSGAGASPTASPRAPSSTGWSVTRRPGRDRRLSGGAGSTVADPCPRCSPRARPSRSASREEAPVLAARLLTGTAGGRAAAADGRCGWRPPAAPTRCSSGRGARDRAVRHPRLRRSAADRQPAAPGPLRARRPPAAAALRRRWSRCRSASTPTARCSSPSTSRALDAAASAARWPRASRPPRSRCCTATATRPTSERWPPSSARRGLRARVGVGGAGAADQDPAAGRDRGGRRLPRRRSSRATWTGSPAPLGAPAGCTS